MIYINSNIVSFPRHSKSEVVLLHLVNQLTQTNIDVEVSDTSTNPKLYTFDLSSAMAQLIAGQYNYYLYSLDKSVVGNGILQVEDYTTEDVNYHVDYNIIQYSPEDEEIVIPIRILTIIENGEYDVTDYDKVIVEVDSVDEEVIEEYEETINNLKVEIDVLNLQNEIKDVEINELKDSNTTLTNDLNSANEQITTLNNEKVYLENINSTLNSELRSANAEINILQTEVEEQQAYIDTATAITITENGTYTPPTGVVGYNSISVDVSGGVNPKYVLSNGTKLGYSTSSTDINNFIFSEISNFGDMFRNCANLTSIPLIDTSKGTNFSYMFRDCSNLTSMPQLDTSKGTNFSYMFYSCTKLTSIPLINTSNGTNFQSMFYNCNNLTSIPAIDTTKGTFLAGMFYNCKKLSEIPTINTSNNTNFSNMFYGCTNLVTIPLINTSKSTNFSNTFYNCTKLENITFEGSINVNIFLPNSPLLTFDSIKSILTAASNTTNTKSKTLTLNRSISDVDGELAALVATCTSKGWTISGLTLE